MPQVIRKQAEEHNGMGWGVASKLFKENIRAAITVSIVSVSLASVEEKAMAGWLASVLSVISCTTSAVD